MLRFDSLNYTVYAGSRSCKLQPLSFRLLEALSSHENEIVPVDTLIREVWEGVLVSPETVKQRVFLLRDALQKAGLNQEMLQSVRGKGYRLVVEDQSGEHKQRGFFSRKRLLIIVIAGILLTGIFTWQWRITQPEVPASNRVVFWYQTDPSTQESLYSSSKQAWISRLSSLEGIFFVAATQAVEPATERPGLKAREYRAGLVSFWTLFDYVGEPFVRMQLLEPKTDSVLLSQDIDISNQVDLERAFEQQVIALQRIFFNGILPLDSTSLQDTDNIKWRQLELLSQPTRDIALAIPDQAELPNPARDAFTTIRKLNQGPGPVDPSLSKKIKSLYEMYPENVDVKRALLRLYSAEQRCDEATVLVDDFSTHYPFTFEEDGSCTPVTESL